MKKIVSVCVIATVMMACNTKAKKEAEILQAKQMTIDSITKVEDIRKNTIDSMQAVAATAKAKEPKVVVVREPSSNHSHASTSTNNSNSSNTSNNSNTTTTTRKKGWSSTAKGAVIGAGVGGITGAMIDKKKGRGAVIGGLLGAGAGAGVGAIIDGKEKRKQ